MLKRRFYYISASAFFVIGFLLIVGNFSGITGYAVFNDSNVTLGFYASLWFFAAGIVLLMSGGRAKQLGLEETIKAYEQGGISPVRAALQVREALRTGGREISGVRYKGSSDNVTVITSQGGISVKLNDEESARNFALGVYEIALINDPRNNERCELHLGKRASSKHYKKGFLEVVRGFEETYKADLAGAKR